jgi:hypothetical protein
MQITTLLFSQLKSKIGSCSNSWGSRRSRPVEIEIENVLSRTSCRERPVENALSRTSFMLRLTFENHREWPSCRDQLLKTVEIESLDRDHVETNRDPQAWILILDWLLFESSKTLLKTPNRYFSTAVPRATFKCPTRLCYNEFSHLFDP